MSLCAISGEVPQNPVVSIRSGNVFEKRLAEAYITENGKDPITGEEMTVEDLIDLKTSRIVRPKPPTFTSIPSLLSVFQNEWDAMALDSYNVRQQLTQTRQELATALYQHDAAIRVITRLTKERDEARDALSKVTIGAGSLNSGDQMQIDSTGLPEELAEKVDATQEKLSKSRRKRPVPKNWASAAEIESYEVVSTSEPLYSGCFSLAVNASGESAIVGGSDGVAGVYSISDNKVLQDLQIGGAITDAVWDESYVIVASSKGSVKVFQSGKESASFTSHAGEASALAAHPSGEIVASVGVDKSFVFYDLLGAKAVMQVYTESALSACAFHPDGHLFATGGIDGKVSMYETNTGEHKASFDCGSPVKEISFSENGIWFAAVTQDSTTVTIFDLRKEGSAAEIKALETGSKVDSIQWDYTGQFLATAGSGGVTVQQYTKASKAWSEPLRNAVPATAIKWGPQGSSLITVNADGVVSVLGAK